MTVDKMNNNPSSPSSAILYPGPGMGHVRPMIELAKLLHHRHSVSVTILLLQPHYHHGSFASYLSHAVSSNPFLSFHTLPPISSSSNPPSSSPHRSALVFQLLQHSNPNLLSFLSRFTQTTRVSALILDFFCTAALEVTTQLHIPTYVFFPSPASFLALFLHFPHLHSRFPATSYRQLGATLITDIPGVPNLPGHHMPAPVLDGPDDDAYRGFLAMSENLPKAQGFVVNTFDAFEKRAVHAITNGPYPPLYCIGPITSTLEDERSSECLPWLDRQPRSSVVFLCFGSMGSFSVEQLRELAVGLERSRQRFLWVVRSPPANTDKFVEPEEPDLERLLPSGFMERTEGRGLVVRSWAPQAAVLGHDAVGGFVSHCGWNSILEAVSAGVAMIAWPLYAEQKMNKVFLVEEAEVAVEMEEDESEMVKAEDVERKVRWLMETEEGKEMKERARRLRESGKAAVEERGSSYTTMIELAIRLKQRVETETASI